MRSRAGVQVWPRTAAPQVAAALDRAHALGPHRTLLQDPVFAIDQLVEIAIRALSPAVNDTFTALTCIDWLSAGLSELSQRSLIEGVYRDHHRRIRLISSDPSYSRMVNRAFDKIRQCAGGMPAVLIRLLDAITAVASANVPTGNEFGILTQRRPRPHVATAPAALVAGNALLFAADERPNLVALDALARQIDECRALVGEHGGPRIGQQLEAGDEVELDGKPRTAMDDEARQEAGAREKVVGLFDVAINEDVLPGH